MTTIDRQDPDNCLPSYAPHHTAIAPHAIRPAGRRSSRPVACEDDGERCRNRHGHRGDTLWLWLTHVP